MDADFNIPIKSMRFCSWLLFQRWLISIRTHTHTRTPTCIANYAINSFWQPRLTLKHQDICCWDSSVVRHRCCSSSHSNTMKDNKSPPRSTTRRTSITARDDYFPHLLTYFRRRWVERDIFWDCVLNLPSDINSSVISSWHRHLSFVKYINIG